MRLKFGKVYADYEVLTCAIKPFTSDTLPSLVFRIAKVSSICRCMSWRVSR